MLSIVGVTILYTIQFLTKSKSVVFSNREAAEFAPVIDLKERNFLIAFKSNVPDRYKYVYQKFFTVEYFLTEEAPDSEIEFEQDRRLETVKPCKDAKFDFSQVNYNPNDIEEALCVEFTDSASLGGSYEKDSVFFLELILKPCQETTPGDCDVDWNGIPTSAVQNLDLIANFFQDYTLEIAYLEDST